MVTLNSIWKLLKFNLHKINMQNQINIETIQSIFREEGLINGRMLSYSKSKYRDRYPDNEVYFNANIFALDKGKVWYGDIDINLDEEILNRIAKSCGCSLYVLSEMDGRFENENLKNSDIIKVAKKEFHP